MGTLEPTPPACTMCDDIETSFQIRNGIDCATDTVRINKKCNKDAKWTNKGFSASAATMQAMGTLETCAVMRLFLIGKICVAVKFGGKNWGGGYRDWMRFPRIR